MILLLDKNLLPKLSPIVVDNIVFLTEPAGFNDKPSLTYFASDRLKNNLLTINHFYPEFNQHITVR